MKSYSPRNQIFEKEFHEFLLANFDGYTVASGNITGYWKRAGRREQCNEHREYQIAVNSKRGRLRLETYVEDLARELGEETIFCVVNGEAFLIPATKPEKGGQAWRER